MSTDKPEPNCNPSGEATPARPAPKRQRLVALRLAAILVGIAPLVLLEAGLRLLDLGRPTNQSDTLAGFNRKFPLFERADDVFRTIRTREPFFNPQEFRAVKPDNGYRVFCFGGSTVYGHPYQSDTAFAKWLELELAASNPSRSVEVVNCGGVSYASYRLAPIVREVLQYQPDLIVLAMGDNEFLEDRTYRRIKARSALRRWLEDQAFSLRIVAVAREWVARLADRTSAMPNEKSASDQLPLEVNTRLDDTRTGYASYHRDDVWHRQVLNQFEDSFRSMIAECGTAKVPVLVVTLGSNLRDCPPFKSEHRVGITPEEENRWQSAFDAATEAEAKDLEAAVKLYQKASAIDDQHALLDYRLARCFDRLGEADRAREHYLRAKNEDICPLRMPDRIYELEHTIATETKTPVVDARAMLTKRSPELIPGNDIYLDHLHPTIGAHQLIAKAIAAKLFELQLYPELSPWKAEARRAAYHDHLQQLPSSYLPNGRRRVEWLDNWARRARLSEETVPKDARGFLHLGYRQLDFNDEDEAWKSFLSALKKDPGTARQLIQHALELLDYGRPESARRLLDRLNRNVIQPGIKTEIEKASAAVDRFPRGA